MTRDEWDTTARGRLGRAMASGVRLVASDDRRRRIRLLQWFIAGGVYVGAAGLLYWGIGDGWIRGGHMAGWSAFVTAGLLIAYVALRSGWSERLRDPAMTELQIVMGVVAVCWAYLICGPMRTLTLFPLLLIFAFAAFSLHWRRILLLTLFTVAALAVVTFVQSRNPLRDVPALSTLPVDALNFAFTLVILPALAAIAARLSALRNALRNRREALTRALAEVQRLATTDVLTGLANRRAMIDRLAHLRRTGDLHFSIAIVDIDHFKRINDRLGHAQGDAVLWRLAELARTVLPQGDILARWGGEEFLLLMPATTAADACARVNALRRGAHRIVIDGRPLTVSAGVACPREGEDVSGLVLRADQAMYAAKQGGRDRVDLAD